MLFVRRSSRMPRLNNFDRRDLGRIIWPVSARVTSQSSNLLYNVKILALAEDGGLAIQILHRNFRDEKLRTVGIRSRIRVSEAARLIEFEIGTHIVLELVSRIASSRPQRISALNHKVGNHTMERGSVV